MQQDEFSSNLKDVNQWTRILHIALFAIAYYAANVVLWVVVLVQIGTSLVTGGPNARLSDFGAGLSHYIFQLARFLTYNSEDKPFPVQDWPDGSWPVEPVTQATVETPAADPVVAQAATKAEGVASSDDSEVKKPSHSAAKKANGEIVKSADNDEGAGPVAQ